MTNLFNCCRICLETRSTNTSLYRHVDQKYLPSVIENICGLVISSSEEPYALTCEECAEALTKADIIIQKCLESHKTLTYQRKVSNNIVKLKTDEAYHRLPATECKKEIELNAQDEKVQSFVENYLVKPEMIVESILENSVHEATSQEQKIGRTDIVLLKETMGKKPRRRRPRLKLKDQKQNPGVLNSEENTAASLYHSRFRTSKPKTTVVRSREQYLKRKIRNFPVKEPLKLIGGAGLVGKRKPKSHHRVIPNFYFRCELCHKFESNVASYAVNHLTSVHGIDRPAIFRCSLCDAKPFIKNQSLQEHIATIHEQLPKKRDYVCRECGKTFIKNCHLRRHLLSIHKMGEAMHYKCKVLKSIHHMDEAKIESVAALCHCDSCGESFMELQALKSHITTKHTLEGFNCLHCGYTFRQKARYETHVTRANCKPPCFVCRFCEKPFVKLVHLEEHQRKKH